MKKDGKDVEGGRCMRGSDGRLNFSEKDRRKVLKEHMKRILNDENEWDQNVKAELVEGPVEKVSREEVVKTIREMKVGKAAGCSKVTAEMIAASVEIGIGVMVELCQGVLDGKVIPDDWALSVEGKGDVMNCMAYRGVKLLEHAMKIVEELLERRLRRMVKEDEMQFGFMPGKRTIDAVFILRRIQEEYLDKEKKLHMCFVDPVRVFGRVPKKVLEWTMRQKGIPEITARAASSKSLYESAIKDNIQSWARVVRGV